MMTGRSLRQFVSCKCVVAMAAFFAVHGLGNDVKPIYDHAVNGNVSAVKQIIESDPQWGSRRSKIDLSQLLRKAVEAGQVDVLRLLVAKGVDVNTHRRGKTPLYWAVKFWKTDVVAYLREQGADIHYLDLQRRSGLQWGILNENNEAIDYFLAVCKIDHQDKTKNTALHLAVLRRAETVAQRLLENGASINLRNEDLKTPLHLAVENRNILKLLLDYEPEIDPQDRDGNTPLMILARGSRQLEERLKSIALLLNAGADVCAINHRWQSSLNAAVAAKALPVVNHLLLHGADINQEDVDGNTVVHHTVRWGDNLELLQLLLKHRPRLDVRNKKSLTALALCEKNARGKAMAALIADHQLRHPEKRPQPLAIFGGHSGRVLCLAVSADGRLAATGGRDKQVVIWDLGLREKKIEFNQHRNDVRRLAFAADGKTILSAGKGNLAFLWKVADGNAIHQFSGSTWHHAMFSRREDLALLCGFKRIWSFDLKSGEETVRFPKLREHVTHAAIGHRPNDLFIWEAHRGLRLLNLATGKLVAQAKSNASTIGSMVWLPKRQQLLTVDRKIRLWGRNATGPMRVFGHHWQYANSAAMLDGDVLLTADKYLRFWDMESGRLRERVEVNEHGVAKAAVIADRQELLVVDGAGALSLWSLADLGFAGAQDGE